MAQHCPQCKTPVPLERRLLRAWLWARWRCKTCDSLLGFNVKRRLLMVLLVIPIAALVPLAVRITMTRQSLILWAFAVLAVSFVAMIIALKIEDIVVIERRGNHCQNCGYNLSGNNSGTCPECGRAVPLATPVPMARAISEARGAR